jgi:excisionase family DNA binding protein
MQDTKLLLRLPEAAARAGVGLTTLRSLIRAGRIAVLPIGRRGIRIPLSALDEWIQRETKGELSKQGDRSDATERRD